MQDSTCMYVYKMIPFFTQCSVAFKPGILNLLHEALITSDVNKATRHKAKARHRKAKALRGKARASGFKAKAKAVA